MQNDCMALWHYPIVGGVIALGLFGILQIYRLRLFHLLGVVLLINALIALRLHAIKLDVCFDMGSFFTMWMALWMVEVPFLISLYLFKLLKHFRTWQRPERLKFVVALAILVIELNLLKGYFSQ